MVSSIKDLGMYNHSLIDDVFSYQSVNSVS